MMTQYKRLAPVMKDEPQCYATTTIIIITTTATRFGLEAFPFYFLP